MNAPSREFMIQQAVLDGFATAFPMARMCDTLPNIMRYFVDGFHIPRWLHNHINAEYRRIASQYERNAA